MLLNAKSFLYIYIKYIWFGLVGFYGILTIMGYLMPNLLYTYILKIYDLVWFGLVLWHINHCRLFNAQSLYIYIKYIRFSLVWFGLVWYYGVLIIVCYLLPNPLYTYILNIWFGLVGFYGILAIMGYLMPSLLYTYILKIYDLVWFGLVLWHINHCGLFNTKSSL